jgi:hypothetical protein
LWHCHLAFFRGTGFQPVICLQFEDHAAISHLGLLPVATSADCENNHRLEACATENE